MKKHLFKFALTLFVCTLSNAALANGDELPNQELAYPPSFHNWSLDGCTYGALGQENLELLKVEKSKIDNRKAGSATTPELKYSGNVVLSFSYATQNDNTISKIKISINNGGQFEGSSSNNTSLTTSTNNSYINHFESKNYKLNNVTHGTTIKFEQEKYNNNFVSFYLDDVKVIKLGEITLNDQINSSEAIAANNETICTVKTVRKLNADKWNTLCLPFNVNKSLLEATFDTNVELRVFDEYDDATYTMKFKTPENNSIAAGTPFLIKVNEDIVNPTFTGVTISDIAAQANGNDGVSFVGTYGPQDLATDGTNLFITTGNELAKPTSTGNKMPGLRAYIVVPKNFNSSARLFLDDEATAINNIGTQKATNSAILYNLQGQRVERPRSGLYIKNYKLTIIR